MKLKSIKVFAPATIANVGPGFDILGVAIDAPGDIIVAEMVRETGLFFSLQGGHVDLPPDGNNVAAHDIAKNDADGFGSW
jgi:homoserine kinase